MGGVTDLINGSTHDWIMLRFRSPLSHLIILFFKLVRCYLPRHPICVDRFSVWQMYIWKIFITVWTVCFSFTIFLIQEIKNYSLTESRLYADFIFREALVSNNEHQTPGSFHILPISNLYPHFGFYKANKRLKWQFSGFKLFLGRVFKHTWMICWVYRLISKPAVDFLR